MIKQKRCLIIICIIVSLFNFKSYSQTEKSNDKSWLSFKNAAHRIGFCIYHIHQEICKEHSQIKNELEKISEPESDVYYFKLHHLWAKKRLADWAESKASKSEDYFILFDIDQNSFKQLLDSTKTSNSYKMFSIFDLKDKFEFKMRWGTFYISSNRANSILTNTLWREFMSNRLGRLDSEIKISLSGTNTLNDYHNFKDAFIKFLKKTN
jgi:hypothetical protein